MTERIFVTVELTDGPVLAGTLHIETRRALSCTFVYDADYLSKPAAYAIDPGLPLDLRPHHTRGLPGALADAAPDRWGRNLIRRRLDAPPTRVTRSLTDIDYLLGVSDATRQGALRFQTEAGGPYLSEHTSVPKLLAMPRMMRAADHVARDSGTDADVKELLDAGSGSLGGARPKASVIDDDGHLHIAKFAHPHDEWDVMAWEATALDLAETAGIRVPERRLVRMEGGAALLVERFDRRGDTRVGYLSAMSLVQGHDGDQLDYLDVAEAMATVSASPAADLEDLFVRVLFGAVIGNSDDHLRNHGFLRVQNGWRLSPAFDLNPNPYLSPHQTSIGGAATAEESIAALRTCSADFGLSRTRADAIMQTLRRSLTGWRSVAAANGAPASEISRMATAIRPDLV